MLTQAAAPRAPITPPMTEAARWTALRARDTAADGRFVYSVKTTGVYCRPSCAARPARPENVAFHASCADAERAGFRACKRCKPHLPPLAERQAAQIAALCRLIERSDQLPSLAELADHAGMSAYHTHRLFKAITGVTPKAYAAAHRADVVRDELDKRATVTEAIYGAGYNSSARFYEQSNAMLGMTPSKYKAGGTDLEIRFAVATCSLGALLVAATPQGVCAIQLGDDPAELEAELARRFPRATLVSGDAAFARTVADVVALVERPQLGTQLPLDIRGTAFQQRVWKALRDIPAGQTASYADIAHQIGAPTSMRAVAQACGQNPLAVAIPCHRVVRSDGDLSGYRWGVDRKRTLLRREGAPITGDHAPITRTATAHAPTARASTARASTARASTARASTASSIARASTTRSSTARAPTARAATTGTSAPTRARGAAR